MFLDATLKNHLENSTTVETRSTILAEWNMNVPDNIFKLGNYRNRDTAIGKASLSFDANDVGNLYTGATDADIVVDNGFANDDQPALFSTIKEQYAGLYSLEDCIKPFRPRSGINKAFYIQGRYLHNFNTNLINNQTFADSAIGATSFFTQRPRYYIGSRYDEFKYWTSFRTEKETDTSLTTTERGISKKSANNQYPIEDAAPFVVYKETVPANRIVVKMQTHVGTKDLGPFNTVTTPIADPLYGNSNKQVPVVWRIEYLLNGSWVSAKTFNANSLRDDSTVIIKEDGYVELSYGLILPNEFKTRFIHVEKISSITVRPTRSIDGYAYLLSSSTTDQGIYHVWNDTTKVYNTFVPEYGWQLTNLDLTKETNFVTDFTSPEYFIKNNQRVYREFQYIQGIRVVAEQMNKYEATLDLIEMSPRLVANISNKTISYSITKQLSDLGNGSLPVGQLLASTGNISIFDDDQAFNENNTNSIIAKYVTKNLKFNFYETFLNVGNKNYSIPIKTLYAEGMPQADITGGTISLELRDFYFYFESISAPKIFLTNISISYAISILLDSIGFSNYIYKRIEGESDPIIPYFYVGPDTNVAEVLNTLAVSTQTAMFFDEYNNFIAMSKNYLMPTSTQRSVDTTLIGSKVTGPVSEIITNIDDASTYSTEPTETLDAGLYNTTEWDETNLGGSPSLAESTANIIQNKQLPNKKLANIIGIASEDKKIYNDGKISYTTRYIDKTYSAFGEQIASSAENKYWVYKPSALWEISNQEELKDSRSSGFTLSALALNSTLPQALPTVVNNQLINNTIDFGEGIYLISRQQGYFYSSGEIIRYDAVEHSVEGFGNVWISSDSEYKNYLNKLKFGGKIFPTGKVRIFAEPYYETLNGVTKMANGPVIQSGRAQFGTVIQNHTASLDPYWSNKDNRKGVLMSSEYLFGGTDFSGTLNGTVAAGVVSAEAASINGVIKRFLSEYSHTETERASVTIIDPVKNKGLVQSSALVFKGKDFVTTDLSPRDNLSYVYKTLDQSVFKHFGTRVRIIGEPQGQTTTEDGKVIIKSIPLNGMTYYENNASKTSDTTTSPEEKINISGNSGGIAVLLNPTTNLGYYFEIIALDNATTDTHNVIFYKVVAGVGQSKAIPIKLFSTFDETINYDSGEFFGISRKYNEENTSIYDLAVEYEDLANGNIRRFYLYINNELIAQVDDVDPLPKYQSTALFVRGSSKCMFENIYALSDNYSKNTGFEINNQISRTFSTRSITANDAIKKYALSGILQDAYLKGINTVTTPKLSIFYDEFGTIMRECAYINAKFDNAYPALYAKIVMAPDKLKEYTISGFQANAYGAEFLVFNATDTLLNLGTDTSNTLRIMGIAFTSDSSSELTVDDYFKKRSNFSDPELKGDAIVYSPKLEKEKYNNLKLSRLKHGRTDFNINVEYIQTTEEAEELMGWLLDKLMVPKKSIGLNIFANPTIQLGDIVSIDYKNNNGLDLVASTSSRFVVYNIEYSRSLSGPDMTIYLSEV